MKFHRKKSVEKKLQYLLLVILLIVIAFAILVIFMRVSSVNRSEKASFDGMIYGSAHKPFVTRVFSSWLTIGFVALIPNETKICLNQYIFENYLLSKIIRLYNVEFKLGVEALVNISIQYLSIVGYLLSFFLLMRKSFRISTNSQIFVLLLGTFGLLPLFKYGFIYDLPQLFLCTLAFYAIVSKKVVLYLIAYVLAVLNKETTLVLLIPSVLLFYNEQKPRSLALLLGIFFQLIIFTLIRVPISCYFRNNLGGSFEFHLIDHLEFFVKDPYHAIIGTAFSVILGYLIITQWKQKPAIFGLGFCAFALLFVLFLVGGYPYELRVFYDVFGILILSISWSYFKLRKIQFAPILPSTEQVLHSLFMKD